MSWYVLRCRQGREGDIVKSCKQHLSGYALEDAFLLRCERLWKSDGMWKPVHKDMFPGYVFLQSSHPKTLSEELEEYRGFLQVLEEDGYLLSIYGREEEHFRELCGEEHLLKLSYGYKDRESGISHITEGPLRAMGKQILKVDWHRRFAQVELPLAKKRAVIWAGVDIAEEVLRSVS